MKLIRLTNKKYFQQFYDSLLEDESSNLLSRMVRLTHKTLENDTKKQEYKIVLELGAGTGQHFRYVQHKFDKYIESDIRKNIKLSTKTFRDNRISFRVIDAQNLSQFKTGSINRIICTCVLIHLDNPLKALYEQRRVINKKNGLITLYVPCEPGLVLRILRYISTVQKAKKYGVDHLFFHYKEHKFNYLFLRTIIEEVFTDYEIKWKKYPFIIGSWNFNLWNICTVNFKKSLK